MGYSTSNPEGKRELWAHEENRIGSPLTLNIPFSHRSRNDSTVLLAAFLSQSYIHGYEAVTKI